LPTFLSDHFKDATLDDVCETCEQLTTENFVLDPVARKAGKLNPATKVSSLANDSPLGDSLKRLLVRGARRGSSDYAEGETVNRHVASSPRLGDPGWGEGFRSTAAGASTCNEAWTFETPGPGRR
jgi:hypothetical protein